MKLNTPCQDHGRTRSIGTGGYVFVGYQGRTTSLHRVVFMEANSLTPADLEGLVVRHKCDNPRCINPEHLESGTQQENMNDMVSRGRSSKRPGERNHQAKLKLRDVEIIREMKGKCTQAELAVRFHVSQKQISRIQRGERWRSWERATLTG
ncbi:MULTISPECIES: HNH endonuclease [Enterobacter cloacae complex]|nr:MULTISPECIES: HNH endonuclease [Enterobacter cloacae complex]MBK4387074.1 HNH endonuclease [Enterobacter hormaechei]MDA4777433.1 HNH endonuclease [Enterobacter hormaechei]NYA79243.1 HNH endonuclease [Enterobacter hormaechei]QFI33384.1 hypothetical protein F1597_15290 [Enterobacter hormaechei]HAS1343168.1 hypothetical protein [Enterobacter hormaechei]